MDGSSYHSYKRGPYKGKTEYGYHKRSPKRDSNNRIIDYKQHIRDNVKVDPVSGCWEWQRAKNNLGYGFIRYKGKSNKLVHRVSYLEFVGPFTEPCIRHICDNPGCANPEHLIPGTHKQNTADMVIRERNLVTIQVATAAGLVPVKRHKLTQLMSEYNRDTRWWNNGVENIRVKKYHIAPDGYVLGRLFYAGKVIKRAA